MSEVKLTTAKPTNHRWIMNALDNAFKEIEGVELTSTENEDGNEDIYLVAHDRTKQELTLLALDTLSQALTRAFTV